MSALSFRLLVLVSVLGLAAAGVVDHAFPQLVPASVSQAIEIEASFGFLEHGWFVAVLVLWAVACLAGATGLLFYRRWARSLSFWMTVVGFALYPLFGPTVASGGTNALTEASATLWGAALALAYFGESVCARFEPTK